MQGALADLPLLGILEIIHLTRQTGILTVTSSLPYAVSFREGEIVQGGILDWTGPDALHACPLLSTHGHFSFLPYPAEGPMHQGFDSFVADWARASDEWAPTCKIIGSPSRLFQGELPLFAEDGGNSARGAAQEIKAPLLDVAQQLAEAVQQGRVTPTGQFEWAYLEIRLSAAGPASPARDLLLKEGALRAVTDHGVSPDEARRVLLQEIQLGLNFRGVGWALRDMTWEQQYLF